MNTLAGKSSKKSAKVVKKAAVGRVGAKPALLAGGNPQIAKADGDAPVQAYLAAMPGWKSAVGRRFDAIIVRNVAPGGKMRQRGERLVDIGDVAKYTGGCERKSRWPLSLVAEGVLSLRFFLETGPSAKTLQGLWRTP